jgi:hypothetical protein
LGEFLPSGRLFTLEIVFKMKEVAQKFWLLVSTVPTILTKYSLGNILGDFFTNTRIWSPWASERKWCRAVR